MRKPAFQNFKWLLCLIQGLKLVLRNWMSQVELSYHLTFTTNSSVRVQEDITVTHTCHKLNDLALSSRSLIRLHVNALVFGPSHLI